MSILVPDGGENLGSYLTGLPVSAPVNNSAVCATNALQSTATTASCSLVPFVTANISSGPLVRQTSPRMTTCLFLASSQIFPSGVSALSGAVGSYGFLGSSADDR